MINFILILLLSPSNIYKEARKAYEVGNFELAEKKFERIIVNYPDDKLIPEVLYWAARVKSDPVKAIEYYRKIIFEHHENSFTIEALYNIAQYYYAAEDYSEAVKSYNEIISKYPSSEYAKLALEWEKGISSLAYIQIGAFSEKHNAVKLAEYTENTLYKNSPIIVPIQVFEESSLYKVKIGPFLSEDMAKEFISTNKVKGFLVLPGQD